MGVGAGSTGYVCAVSDDGTRDVTQPDDTESALGVTLCAVWFFMTVLGGGAALLAADGTTQSVIYAVLGIGWLIGGLWWLGLFLRRVGRSYRAGVDDP